MDKLLEFWGGGWWELVNAILFLEFKWLLYIIGINIAYVLFENFEKLILCQETYELNKALGTN